MYPFGTSEKRELGFLGFGLEFTFVGLTDRWYLGPVGLATRVRVAKIDEFDVQLRADLHLNTVSAGEIRDIPVGRDTGTFGVVVRREDDHRFTEVRRAAPAVGDAPVLEDLEEFVEDGAVRLVDLVEQQDTERPLSHRRSELPTLLVAHIARRRAQQPLVAVLLTVLAHVEPNEGIVGAEEREGERLRHLGLSRTRRPRKEQNALRAPGRPGVRAREPRPRTEEHVHYRTNRRVLALYAPSQVRLDPCEPVVVDLVPLALADTVLEIVDERL